MELERWRSWLSLPPHAPRHSHFVQDAGFSLRARWSSISSSCRANNAFVHDSSCVTVSFHGPAMRASFSPTSATRRSIPWEVSRCSALYPAMR